LLCLLLKLLELIRSENGARVVDDGVAQPIRIAGKCGTGCCRSCRRCMTRCGDDSDSIICVLKDIFFFWFDDTVDIERDIIKSLFVSTGRTGWVDAEVFNLLLSVGATATVEMFCETAVTEEMFVSEFIRLSLW
jgi:hypothetical protein